LFAPHTYIFVLRAHPIRGESHNQRNTTGEVATLPYPRYATEDCNRQSMQRAQNTWSIGTGLRLNARTQM